MSYSRWLHSTWYTYWSTLPEGTKATRDNQVFEVCAVTAFTYKELKEDIDKCLDKVVECLLTPFTLHINGISPEDTEATQSTPVVTTAAELEELRGYMLDFMDDVESDETLCDPLHKVFKEALKV